MYIAYLLKLVYWLLWAASLVSNVAHGPRVFSLIIFTIIMGKRSEYFINKLSSLTAELMKLVHMLKPLLCFWWINALGPFSINDRTVPQGILVLIEQPLACSWIFCLQTVANMEIRLKQMLINFLLIFKFILIPAWLIVHREECNTFGLWSLI